MKPWEANIRRVVPYVPRPGAGELPAGVLFGNGVSVWLYD